MSSDHVTLADYGAELAEPTPETDSPTETSDETTGLTLENYSVDLESDVRASRFHDIVDEVATIQDVVARLCIDESVALRDLEAIGRKDDVATRFEQRWGITRSELERRASAHHIDDDGPRERFCDECGNRVTEMTDGNEAGHKKGDRPEEATCSKYIGGEE